MRFSNPLAILALSATLALAGCAPAPTMPDIIFDTDITQNVSVTNVTILTQTNISVQVSNTQTRQKRGRH